ncbi:probable pectinesterase/pectinesterase inhibitor 58 [Triticum urartu]|uniref:probable pectinesterase/pectinesterase inhibitor 58 n=1 Tax=Triticum urartu TaxID=4572 RepID=UPI0020439B83|nr:probable pectinesterase/pectinesterase inhibitor 58 [Triticum urartu]
MTNKAATASIIAAVGVVAVIGTIAAVTTSKKASDDGGNMSTSIKLSQLCSSTLYPAKCENSLTPVVNESSNPEEVLRAALQVAMNEVGAAFAKYSDVGKGATDKITLSAIGECKKLLDDAIVDLKDMAGLRADQVVVQVNDLRVWISGVMTYIYTCADGFDKPELKKAMDKLLTNSTELSSNALAIITRVGQFLHQGQDAKSGSTVGGSRRLLGWYMGDAHDVESRRRLLAINGRLDEIAVVRDASRRLLSETMDEITEMSHDGDRHLSETMDQIDEMSHDGDRHLSETMDQIDEMSHNGDRHLQDVSTSNPTGNVSTSNLTGKANTSQVMSFGDGSSASMFFGVSNLTKEADFVRRRLLSMTYDGSSENEVKQYGEGNKRRLLNDGLSGDEVKQYGEGNKRRLLNDASSGDEVKQYGEGNKRRLLNDASSGDEVKQYGEGNKRRLLNDASSGDEVKQYGEGNKRRLLSDASSGDEVKQYGEGNKRRLLNDASSGDEVKQYGEGNKRRLLNDASSGDEVKQYGEGNKRRLLNDASSGDKVKQYGEGNKRRLLNDASSGDEVKQYGEGNKRRLLNDASLDNEVKQYGEGNRRKLLSTQMQSIADMSAQMNRRLLATELPEDLAGKRQLLSNKLVMIYEVAKEANCELEAIDNGRIPEEEEDQRVLATEVVGTIEDLPNNHRRKLLSAGVFPEWVSSHTRRLLQIPGGLQKPNAVVAADGSGNFKTITEALNSVPKKSTARFVIYVKAGEYKEYVTVNKDLANVFMYGDGPTKTRVIGDKSNKGGFATIATRTFSAEGNGFICKSMGFVNTAGPDGHQAVALHVQGDMSVFFNCRFEGYQDTLYVHANRQFFRNCEVLGTIDFIFGNSAAVFQNCLMTVRKPMESQGNMVTAHGRTDPNMPTGIVLQGCKIVPEDALFPVRQTVPSYLGRPWKEYSRTVVMESTIGDLIKPEGWSEWMGDFGLKTLYYAEYANTGPGAGTSKRVTWPGYRVIGQAEATQFTAGVFIDGMSWLKNTGTPNVMGFIK